MRVCNSKCVIENCKNAKLIKKGKNEEAGVTFHRFPKNALMRQKWVNALHLWNENITYSFRVCSDHFLSEDFDKTVPQRIRLRSSAVPFLPFSNSEIKSEIDIDSDESESNDDNFFSDAPDNSESIIDEKNEITSNNSESLIVDRNETTLNNSEPIIDDKNETTPINSQSIIDNKKEPTTEKSLALEFNALDDQQLGIPDKEIEIVDENEFEWKEKKFVDRATSVSPKRILNSPAVQLVRLDCNRRVEEERKKQKALSKKLRVANLKIADLEKELCKLKEKEEPLGKASVF